MSNYIYSSSTIFRSFRRTSVSTEKTISVFVGDFPQVCDCSALSRPFPLPFRLSCHVPLGLRKRSSPFPLRLALVVAFPFGFGMICKHTWAQSFVPLRLPLPLSHCLQRRSSFLFFATTLPDVRWHPTPVGTVLHSSASGTCRLRLRSY